MTGDNDRSEEGYEKPVVHDRRRIDPETGKVRGPAGQEAPSSVDGGAPAPAEAPEGGPAGAAAPEVADELARAQAEALDLADQLARRKAELYNLQQEYNAYVRRSKADAAAQRQAGAQDVVEALLGVLDELELARQHGDLTGPFAAIAEKLEGTLAQRFEVERYGAVGEEFDPAVHEALMHSTDPEATATTVTQVLQPGYRAGERVLRAARVAVSSPE
ncbi:nucleotide exchange factor GrpE [Georgenia sp. EYE_87]|uniref:nucleotide exchange factor GrpE n=1 Tax=Georgenia sp. EYE_87 TaxID=2853448 RepID=UPI00200542BA|nr:nucleotide exchange factor GrpE [Georgenia sp. EYE_87]MCK6209598.1 nucleotide exchange factor GrpE [Georgenia sp. EYE_87]